MTTEKKNKLILFWESIEKTGDKIKATRAARSLQRQAEIDVADANEKYEQANNAFEKAKVDAKDNTKEGFVKIVNSYKKMLIEKRQFDDAVAIYKELFEEPPRLL